MAAAHHLLLCQHNITHVVNCTSGVSKIKNYHEGKLKYFEFDVTRWMQHVGEAADGMAKFVNPMFAFVDEALDKGEGVLIHCLAGAHRAGSTPVLEHMNEFHVCL
jgi:predicted protein tyrosine phosphatase